MAIGNYKENLEKSMGMSTNRNEDIRKSIDPTKPHNNLPPLPPRADIETRAILKKCLKASVALAELRIEGKRIPNQDVLINTIPLIEGRDSSAIENIVTTTDELFEHANLDEEFDDPAKKEASRYPTALKYGHEAIVNKPLVTATSVEICRIIKGTDLDIRQTTGTTLRNDRTGEIIYTPPEGEQLLRDMLTNWEKFLHSDADIDPLVLMAIGHYQFEAIHPFIDGNGRTGRIVNILYLIEQELLELPVLYLSRYILKHREKYYKLLNAVTYQNDWEPWILFMLDAIEVTAIWTTEKIRAMDELMTYTADHIREQKPKIYSRELIDLIFIQPYCRISTVIEAGIAKRNAASRYLRELIEIGVLEEHRPGREKVFVHPKYLNLLKSDGNQFDQYQNP